jgi:hypothetical protein
MSITSSKPPRRDRHALHRHPRVLSSLLRGFFSPVGGFESAFRLVEDRLQLLHLLLGLKDPALLLNHHYLRRGVDAHNLLIPTASRWIPTIPRAR